MCDTFVVVPPSSGDGTVWFGKNSDREPGEAQLVQHVPGQSYEAKTTVRCTHVEIPQAGQTYTTLLSRPFWMWGCEMGANEHGLVIGNEAVFTRLPVPDTGLTGMDFVRLALERTTCAEEALDFMTTMLQEYGQGGGAGYRSKGFRYHNAFILADPSEAWVLETAGKFWAAERVRGVRTISNVLSIGENFDRISDGAYAYASRKGWANSANSFHFARSFGSPSYRLLTGGEVRRACTLQRLSYKQGHIGLADCIETLTDHNHLPPKAGWRMKMPCAHASWWPTRHAGQTTASMICHLTPTQTNAWLTATSSPCLSVFKPVVVGHDTFSFGDEPAGQYDEESIFWQHEMLHRLVLQDYPNRRAIFEKERHQLQQEASNTSLAPDDPNPRQKLWTQHHKFIKSWIRRVKPTNPTSSYSPSSLFWQRQNKLDHIPS